MNKKQEHSNPFTVITPVRGMFFTGRDELLRKTYHSVNLGESVSLVGERRTGKTSVLLRILDMKEQYLSQPDQHILVFRDFLGLEYDNDADIWITLLSTLLEETDHAGLETNIVAKALEELKSKGIVFHTLLRMFKALANNGVQVTFLFDEFESTVLDLGTALRKEKPVDLRFYKILRNLALDQKTKVNYVIATRQELSKVEFLLEQQFTSLSSPLFNIFHQLIVPLFSEDEARRMINVFLESAGLDFSAKLNFWLQRDFLFQLSGFHPFFLQMACKHLFEQCVCQDGTLSEQVPKDKIVSAFTNEANSHFSYYWEISSGDEKKIMNQLSMSLGNTDIQSHKSALNKLHNRCLVIEDKTEWRLFSSAFDMWLKDQISSGSVQYMTDKPGKSVIIKWKLFIFIFMIMCSCFLIGYLYQSGQLTHLFISPIQRIFEPDAGEIWKETLTGMEFAWIPSGCYNMGCRSEITDCFVYEKPVHKVCVDGFWMGKYEVTQGEWKKVMKNNPSASDHDDNYPVEMVSWSDAKEFLRQFNKLTGNDFRLPTEAEWEYACRNGGKPDRYSGGDDVNRVAWYMSNSEKSTHPVGRKAPNGLGVYDMSGNVWEWCEDIYSPDAYTKHSLHNPLTNEGSGRVLRGGSSNYSSKYIRCTFRLGSPSEGQGSDRGVRLVKKP